MSAIQPTAVLDPPRAVTIFGREPAAWVGLIEAILAVLVAFALGISQETFGPILAVVSAAAGVYTAWATKDTMLGVIVGLAKAVIGLTAVCGLTLTDQQVAGVIALTAVTVGFFQRTQTSPVAAPVDPSPQQVVPVLPTEDVAAAIIPGTLPASSQTFDPHVDDDYDPKHDRP